MADQLWLMTRIREEEEWVDKFSWVRANSGSADRWSNGLTNSDGPVVSGSDDDDGGDDDGGGDGDMSVSCGTERAGHARELVKELVLTDWYGIVIVSGDGLIFEVCFCMSVFNIDV